MLTKEQLERYLKNECSDTEKVWVASVVEKYPEIIDELLQDDDWISFNEHNELPHQQSSFIWKKIQSKTTINRSYIVWLQRITVAAACIAMIALSWNSFFVNKRVLNKNIVRNQIKEKNIPSPIIKHNQSSKPINIVLEDASEIILSPNSTVQYDLSFKNKAARIVHLYGEALFKVTKNKKQPFTVYSGAIGTTALGTSFTIKAFEKDNYIKVHLHTGKVVVKASEKMTTKNNTIGNRFLYPSNVLLYHKANGTVSIKKTINQNKHLAASKDTNMFDGNNWFMFNNQPLSLVFDQLEEIYGVKIHYQKSAVHNMFFIGKLDKTDRIHTIIEAITTLNKLKLTLKNNEYYINK